MKVVIDIGKSFSRFPAGRDKEDGPFSGERFCIEFLLPEINKNREIDVLLDGTAGYGSSFLEEAFGGLVRRGVSGEHIHRSIKLLSEDQSLIKEIWGYIDDEVTRAGGK